MRRKSGQSEQIVFDAIVRAAHDGRPCPSNAVICDLTGASSVSHGALIISRLEKRGMIVVTRFQCGRDVFVPSIGKSTTSDGSSRTPHWRLLGAGHRKARAGASRARKTKAEMAAIMVDRIDDDRLPAGVFRDPCPRCGTRADYGCAHRHVGVSMGAF
jgi:hypothetical protein